MLPDHELSQLHSGDEIFFTRIHRRYASQFEAFLRRSLGYSADVDDVLQEVWFRVFEHRATFKNQSSLDSWLWAICRNTRTDWLRSQQRREMLDARSTHVADSTRLGTSLVNTIAQDEALQVLLQFTRQAILALPERQFEAVIYRWILGHSTELTARLMHVSAGTVKATLHQVRDRLRTRLPRDVVMEWLASDD